MQSVMYRSMRRDSVRTVVAGLLLPVFLLRAWIPVGYMPVADAGGVAALIVCPGVHNQDEPIGNPAGKTPDPRKHNVPCVFTASAAAAPMPAILALVPGSIVTLAVPSAPAVERFCPSILRSQSPRAPPHFGWS